MNRSELVFLYDIAYANPNGDPLDSNRPRIDEENEINLVTDVRLKRTIRDYLHDSKKKEIFIIETKDDDGNIDDSKKRANKFGFKKEAYQNKKEFEEAKMETRKNIIEKCIDIRLFGATIPVSANILNNKNEPKEHNDSITLTGPVQFRMGKSLNKVEIKDIKGTGAFASSDNKKQKTFREEYILPYSLICFYGIVNENAAKSTNLLKEDVELLLEGIWNGTKNLISRSKFGQMPRMLLQIKYKDDNFFIGDLNNKISITNYDNDKKLRRINELEIDLDSLVDSLMKNKDKIEQINYKIDDEIRFKDNISIEKLLNGFDPEIISEINF